MHKSFSRAKVALINRRAPSCSVLISLTPNRIMANWP